MNVCGLGLRKLKKARPLVTSALQFRHTPMQMACPWCVSIVDTASVKAAIRLNGYFEDSYRRIRSFVAEDMCEEPPKVLLSLLPDTFDTKTAIAIGKELQNVSERTVMNYLKELCRSRLLRKSKAGHYEKIIYDKSGKFNMTDY